MAIIAETASGKGVTFSLNFYRWNYGLIAVHIAALVGVYIVLRRGLSRKAWRIFNACFTAGALAVIAEYSILGRMPSYDHEIVFFSYHGSEFYREMIMNALLYFPLGLALTELTGFRSAAYAFVLSASVEAWQYFAGTGVAQGTDILMNTAGCALGTISGLFAGKPEKGNKRRME